MPGTATPTKITTYGWSIRPSVGGLVSSSSAGRPMDHQAVTSSLPRTTDSDSCGTEGARYGIETAGRAG
jgi:hypothetical protein